MRHIRRERSLVRCGFLLDRLLAELLLAIAHGGQLFD